MVEPNKFAQLASDTQIERTRRALEAKNIHAIVAKNGADVKIKLFVLVPDNTAVIISNPAILDVLGIPHLPPKKINKSGPYVPLRVKLIRMERKTENREVQMISTIPEYMISTVHAVTEMGQVIVVSETGSPLAGYADGAAHIIWIVGIQKIVATLDAGMKYVDGYTFTLKDVYPLKEYGMQSSMKKLLIVNNEFMPSRATMILVKEKLGF